MKKFNFKVIIASILVIVGFVFIILGKYVNIFTNLGLIAIGVAIFLFLLHNSSKIALEIRQCNEVLQDETSSEEEISLAIKLQSKLKSRDVKNKICFSIFGLVLIIVGFVLR